jgi:hypothetical protein
MRMGVKPRPEHFSRETVVQVLSPAAGPQHPWQ